MERISHLPSELQWRIIQFVGTHPCAEGVVTANKEYTAHLRRM